MTQSQLLTFPSVTPMLKWANVLQVNRLDEKELMVYVQKDGLYYYFGHYPEAHEFRLIMTSSEDITEPKEN